MVRVKFFHRDLVFTLSEQWRGERRMMSTVKLLSVNEVF